MTVVMAAVLTRHGHGPATACTVVEPSEETPLDEAEAAALREAHGRVALVHVAGPLSSGAASGMARSLEIPGDYRVPDRSKVPFIDSSATLALEGMIRHGQGHGHGHGKTVILMALQGPVPRMLARLGALRLFEHRRRFRSRLRGPRHAADQARGEGPPSGIQPSTH